MTLWLLIAFMMSQEEPGGAEGGKEGSQEGEHWALEPDWGVQTARNYQERHDSTNTRKPPQALISPQTKEGGGFLVLEPEGGGEARRSQEEGSKEEPEGRAKGGK